MRIGAGILLFNPAPPILNGFIFHACSACYY